MFAFDSYPVLYWLPVYTFCWILFRLSAKELKVSDRWFLVVVVGQFLLMRLPSIVYNQEINPDESQMIAQALTLRFDPIYFRSVDGTTGGPLDSYFLIIPSFLGLPFDYITAHLTAFVLIVLIFLPLFNIARLWFGSQAARLALLPFLWLFGLTQHADFLHYSSELIAVALLSWAYYLYAAQLDQSGQSVKQIALIGLLVGAVPFGKLQGTPLAVVVCLFVAIHLLTQPRLSTKQRLHRLAALFMGCVLFPALATGLLWVNNVYDDFLTFYITANLTYATGSDPIRNLLDLPNFFRKGIEFDWVIKLTGVVWLIGFVLNARTGLAKLNWNWQIQGFLIALLAAALYSVTRTGSEYVHYLFFLIGPVMLWLAYSWQQLIVAVQRSRWLATSLLAIFLLGFGVQAAKRYRQHQPLNAYPSDQQKGWRMPQSPVARAIRQYAQPGEKLAVWGWRCDYYVQTQMPQAVAENHTIRSAFEHPMKLIYQRRYVSNLIRSLPPVFVDAVGSRNLWMTDRAAHGHETCKPLKQLIDTHYQLVDIVDDTRIYARLDRLKNQFYARQGHYSVGYDQSARLFRPPVFHR